MKINNIATAYPPLIKKSKQNDKPQVNTSFSSNPIKLHYYKPINFCGTKSLTVSKLYENGYEDIQINNDGKIANKGKFLIIKSPEHLSAISKTTEALGKNFILTENIDMKDINFQPIGSVNDPFTGVFDGNGYIINNLTINKPNATDVGFFASCEDAKILNLSLENVNISAKNEVGGLVGSAQNSVIKNCSIEGNINGEVCVGGLIGLSKGNQIHNVITTGEIKSSLKNYYNNIFEDSSIKHFSSYFGGIVAIDEGSTINASYSNTKIISEDNIGGIVGSTSSYMPTKINDSVFNGVLVGEKFKGAIVGNSGNTILTRCYALGMDLSGNDSNCRKAECFNSLNDIKSNKWMSWNPEIWNTSPKMLPRLKFIQEKANPIIIFLEDVNNSRKIGIFTNSTQQYVPPEFIDIPLEITPPKHYDKNDEILNEIKNCKNSKKLLGLFALYSDIGWNSGINCLEQPENDEILLELVKNKYLPINQKCSEGYSVMCTPVYIATRIGKPYILKEILKRDDIDLYVKSGPGGGEREVFDVMQDYCADNEIIYTFYSSKNPRVQKYIKEKIKESNDSPRQAMILDVMNQNYPNIPEYDLEEKVLKIPRKYIAQLEGFNSLVYDSNNYEMQSLEDVQRNMDVNPNFKDSNGNNIINLSVTCKDEAHGLDLYKRARARGTEIYNRNKNAETPVQTLLKNGINQHILAEIITEISNPNEVNDNGENAMHIFSKNINENKGILLIEKAIKAGLSVNSRDSLGNTPLMNALDNKYYNMVNFLLENGADVNICDENGQNALHRACLNYNNPSDMKYIYVIINQNAHTDLKDINGNKPFEYLDDIARELVNLDENSLINIKEELKDNDMVYSSFLTNPVQYDEHSKMLKNCNISEAEGKEFIPIKTSKINFNRTLNYYELENNLLDSKKQNETLILLNSELRKNKYMPSHVRFSDDNNILHLVSKIHSPFAKECINTICSQNMADINKTNDFQETPLMVAIDSYQTANNAREKLNCTSNIITLLKFKPDINMLDQNKQNVLHRICQMDNVILLGKLLDMDANINQKDITNSKPVEYLSTDPTDKMRIYYENYVLKKNLRLGYDTK